MKRFRNKNLMKRAITFLFVLVTVFTLATPLVFAKETFTEPEEVDPNAIEDVSGYSQTIYEDLYIKNKNLEDYGMLGPKESFKLTNKYSFGQNVCLYLICEPDPFLTNSKFRYEFMGTMDVNNRYCDIGFSFDFGLLGNKSVTSEVELKGGSKMNVREYQFAVYPGYYNFFNNSMNEMKMGSDKAMLIQTLTPTFDFGENISPSSRLLRVEVKPKQSVRVYAVLGSPEWKDANEADIEAWAMQIEKETSENMANRTAEADPETVAVTPNNDKVVSEIQKNEVKVDEVTKEPDKFKDTKDIKTEKPSSKPTIVTILVVIVVGIAGVVIGKKVYLKYKKS